MNAPLPMLPTLPMTLNLTAGDRLTQQLQFITELDRLKTILRQTLLIDQSRRENSAEHSWHIAMMAILFADAAPQPIDLLRVIKMLLIHDVVEIDSGDTFCYDVQANLSKGDREQSAAHRIFGLLPPDQGPALRSLWDEFEAQTTPEAQFAVALDRLQPLLHNLQTQGGTWRQHHIHLGQVRDRMAPIQTGLPTLWPQVEAWLDSAVEQGYLQPAPSEVI